ncbi:E3 ubiquitin-protein ligase ATL4 [Magnolia sinica]|uniref:E3 ubiquitin-protein ligase ATL4 n=1 Tax=Magnolia sinica TaxID=86752 RepID=UPI002657DB6A|nr:E3 ubiquitin-protein ligase ATL4 [Magnolia sinica]
MPHRQFLQYLSDFPSPPPPPPPPLPTKTQTPPSSKGLNPSILIIALILTLVFLISASLHFLLRYIDRLRHPYSPPNPHHPIADRHVSHDQQTFIDSLPIFSFDSVTAFQKSAPDCAVCLSRFEPHDQLRFLPTCCHAFHARCIDTWLSSNRTCPLCRSTIDAPESAKTSLSAGESFRIEIGSVSRRRGAADSGNGSRRSYSVGSFDYIIDDDEVVVVVAAGASECSGGAKDKEEEAAAPPLPPPPGAEVAEAAGGRGWLKEYVDRLASSASSSLSSSRALSFRLRGAGTSRRSDVGAAAGSGSWDLEGCKIGEEGSNFFRWLTGA